METYHGHVRTPADAIILFEACRLGLLPRVQRRLSEKERQSIKSGSVFVWDEREAGMRRWTDGKSWSASRVSGSFLTYREMEGKRGGSGFPAPVAAARAGRTPDSTRGSDSDLDMAGTDDGPDGYRYKPDGLMKQSFSITTSTGEHLHLISYYARSHPAAQGLMQPTNDPALRHIRPQKGMYPESTVHEQQNVPVVTRAPMGGTPFAMTPHAIPVGPPAYARPPSAHQGAYPPPAYGWPPSPISTPPAHYAISQYPPGALPPPSAVVGQPPAVQYAPVMPPPTSQPVASAPYDRPVETSLPHPPPPLHRSPAASAGPAPLPLYVPNPSPRVAPAALVTPPQPPPLQGYTSSPIIPKIESRLTPSLAQPIHSGTRTPPSSSAISPASSRPEISEPDVPPMRTARDDDTSRTIPSIGTLISQANESPAAIARAASRTESRSPLVLPPQLDGPHDIPSEKLGFGEDMRALRVLDRAFSA
ncbi:hypothetical protein L228DRAFT_269224 [Xylona heveae TC161]|uniref:Camp independent regulatory protein n=1 Tax=Xylona heveae (strain CBS 132557 / TC161) TaxID=1328760 RepID=A0A165G5S1_XYLHT|nr:hypothetical protein L228DRAFT_269224 [Xylona heveae TC161]KZF21769.1 hypothetical protein L228DRAFT_269224 [Xylona heveae TC161]